MDKIVQLSELFNVSTDYLLKDGVENCQGSDPETAHCAEHKSNRGKRILSEKEVTVFLREYRKAAKRIAASVAALILSPCPAILADSAVVTAGWLPSAVRQVKNGGDISRFLIMAAAIIFLVREILKLKRFTLPDYPDSVLDRNMEKKVFHEQESFQSGPYIRNITFGVAGCILSVIPLIIGSFASLSAFAISCLTVLMFIIVSVSVDRFIYVGLVLKSFKKLLHRYVV